MGSSVSLLRRAERLKQTLTPVQAPRDYVILLQEGQEVSPALLAKLGTFDTLTIRYIPPGFFPDMPIKQHMSCWLVGERGARVPCVVSE